MQRHHFPVALQIANLAPSTSRRGQHGPGSQPIPSQAPAAVSSSTERGATAGTGCHDQSAASGRGRGDCCRAHCCPRPRGRGGGTWQRRQPAAGRAHAEGLADRLQLGFDGRRGIVLPQRAEDYVQDWRRRPLPKPSHWVSTGTSIARSNACWMTRRRAFAVVRPMVATAMTNMPCWADLKQQRSERLHGKREEIST